VSSAPGPTALVAVDLDQTLIYSTSGRFGAPTPDAEIRDEVRLHQVEAHAESGTRTFIAEALPALVDALRERATVVPVTTRTRAQFERIAPLGSIGFDPSLCSNGGTLLVNGRPDAAWAAEVTRDLVEDGWTVGEAAAHLDGLGLDRKAARVADGIFCYVVVADVDAAQAQIDRIQAEYESHGWVACLSGRKLYALPAGLTKARAVVRLAKRLGAPVIVAIGDSVLDLPMLSVADYSIAPAHADRAVRQIADHVTASSGPLAAMEALTAAAEWLALSRTD